MTAMQLVDTHCHIQDTQTSSGDDATRSRWRKAGNPDPDVLIRSAQKQGVTKLLCVGCTLEDSQKAVAFAASRDMVRASIGIHPHEAKLHLGGDQLRSFAALAVQPKVVAIGECGLDYFYAHSPKSDQVQLLRFQIELALKHNLPMIFHVRDSFDDFWPVFDEYTGVRGVVHSFSAGRKELDEILRRGLYVGLNGIMTFTKDADQLAAARAVPLDRLLLETDAPFLTPTPYRGTICEPRHVRVTAEFLADLRNESLASIAEATTHNAHMLFDF